MTIADIHVVPLDVLDRRLIEGYQRDLPLCAEPYAAMGRALEVSEAVVLYRLARLRERGALSPADPRLLNALEGRLPLISRPYAVLGERCGQGEVEVIRRLAVLQAAGVVERLGLVARHHEIGYRANAMTVMDVPDDLVDAVGERLTGAADVTPCYRRPRRLPDWPCNLFTMVHARTRPAVETRVRQIRSRLGVACHGGTILYSRRILKTTGRRLVRKPPKSNGRSPCSGSPTSCARSSSPAASARRGSRAVRWSSGT